MQTLRAIVEKMNIAPQWIEVMDVLPDIRARLDDTDEVVRRDALVILSMAVETLGRDEVIRKVPQLMSMQHPNAYMTTNYLLSTSAVREASNRLLVVLCNQKVADQCDPALLIELDSNDALQRLRAIKRLQRSGRQAAPYLRHVIGRLSDHDRGVRSAAVKTLSGIGAQEVALQLTDQHWELLLRDAQATVRSATLNTLLSLANEGMGVPLDIVSEKLNDVNEDARVRQTAAQVVLLLAPHKVLRHMALITTEEQAQLRQQVVAWIVTCMKVQFLSSSCLSNQPFMEWMVDDLMRQWCLV